MFSKIAAIAALATAVSAGKWVNRGAQRWFFSSGKYTFKFAENWCRKHHTRVAAIDNMGDQRFAMRHSRGHTYIAINDRRHEGRWVNHGRKARFTYWGRGEPNNWHNEDCTLMNWGRGGRWNDIRCNYKAKFACKKTKRAPRKPRHHGATFANHSFLRGHNAFKEAQARRMRYIRQHMKLVRARYVAAHKYFAAKNRAEAMRKYAARWNKAYRLEVRRHQKAIRHHI